MKKLGLFASTITMVCLIYSIACVSPASKHVNQGDTYYQQGQWEQAIAEYEEASKIVSTPELNLKLASAYAQQAIVQYDKEEYDNAITDYEKAHSLLPTVGVNPKIADAYFKRGNAYFDKGDMDKAIADYTYAIELNLNSATVYNNLGWAYYEKGDYTKAIDGLDKAVELDPNFAQAYENRCITYRDKGDYDKAIADCSKWIELAPQDYLPYAVRAKLYEYNKKEYSKSIDDLDVAISLAKTEDTDTQATLYLRRGICHFMQAGIVKSFAEFDKSFADLDKSIQLDPKNAGWAYIFRSDIYLIRGETTNANNDLEMAAQSQDTDAAETAKKMLKENSGGQ